MFDKTDVLTLDVYHTWRTSSLNRGQ